MIKYQYRNEAAERLPIASRPRVSLRPASALASLLVIAVMLCCGCSTEPEDERPDVILVMIDTLRPDHLGFYGYEEETAPFLASLSKNAAVFTRAHSTSTWTAPATASLFTGLYPTDHGVTRGFFAHRRLTKRVQAGETVELSLNRMPSSVPTLPELFQAAGYRTFGLATNVNIGPEIGFDRGFDHFERLADMDKNASPGAEVIRGKLSEWQSNLRASGPNFVYLHFMDPHGPYNERDPWFERNTARVETTREAAYDSEISYLDAALEDLFAEMGWAEDAIVVVVSDHGEEFKEHGHIGHSPTLYNELLRVLAMIHAPVLGVGPGRIEANISLIDMVPTLCALAGVETSENLPGLNLSALLLDQSREAALSDEAALSEELEQRLLFAHRELDSTDESQALWAVIRGSWKLIRGPEGSLLFESLSDPLDQVDRREENQDLAESLEGTLDLFAESASWGEGERGSLEIDAEVLERLGKLGYVE